MSWKLNSSKIGSAVTGAASGASLLGSVTQQPYNISVLHISNVIVPEGLDNMTSSSPSPSSKPANSPSPAKSPLPEKSPPPRTSHTSPPSPSPSSSPSPADADSTDADDSPSSGMALRLSLEAVLVIVSSSLLWLERSCGAPFS